MDPGGYFIINGSEKTVLAQERAADNKIYCFNANKNNSKWLMVAELKAVPDFICISAKQINMMISSKDNGFGHSLYIKVPRLKNPIPVFVLFRALGVESDKKICEYIVLNIEDSKMDKMMSALKASIVDSSKFMTQEEALINITTQAMFTPMGMSKANGERKKREFTEDVLANDLFPNAPSRDQKVYYLGYMVNRLLQCYFGWIKEDDRDSYINKQVDATGVLLNNLGRNLFNNLVKDIRKQIKNEIKTGSWRSRDDYLNIINDTNVYKIVKTTILDNGFKRSLSTGDFGAKGAGSGNNTKVGVAQVLNRLSYPSSLSHLRRINTPIDKSGKLIQPRKLHPTTWGFLCPAETPEGASIGVVKNLSYLTHVSTSSSSQPSIDYILPEITKFTDLPDPSDIYGKVKVFVNGNWLGITHDPVALYADLKEKKYQGMLNIYTAIIFDIKNLEIRVYTDGGRLTRPLLKVRDNKILLTDDIIMRLKNHELTWDDLFTNHHLPESVLEYIDVEEQNYCMIAMKPAKLAEDVEVDGKTCRYNYTHCEIHPSTIFGVVASCIPFPEHNQSPRNTYQCAMGKQSMGVYMTNYDSRMDKTAYVLSTPMRPLVDTRVMNIMKLNQAPSGSMVIVAIATYSGYNQEDSIIVNRGAIERGLFSATIYHTERDEDKKIHGDEEVRCRPDADKTKGMKFANYSKLTSKGVMPENTLIKDNDVIMGKVVPIKENRNDHTKVIKFQDESHSYRTREECYVDKNYIDCNGDGYSFCKVRVRAYRQPVIGDKLSSRHGQKGTTGVIMNEEDMPFTADGVRPDIIINPHALPSRMTIAQLKETLLGKVLIQIGMFGDGTSFSDLSVDFISKELLNLGFEKNGNEVLMNGMSGEQMETSVFMGPAFYQRLKHMVKDKQHSRSIGPMVVLTRQPAEGRSRDGGHRFGEMERDCTISHGISRFTKGRLYDSSDKFQIHVCNKCGMTASYNDARDIHLCKTCDNRVDFSYVELPYACKLLFQELTTMNVLPRILTEQACLTVN
jgi:DNA-directed RNA polymerase II subunit RPB2